MILDSVVILAGGQSSRFWPLSHKNLLTFAGKPLIVHQIERCLNLSSNCIVIANKETYDDISRLAQQNRISNVVLQDGDGQASAILSARKHIIGKSLILNGNDIYDEKLFHDLLSGINKNSNIGYLTATKVDSYVPGGYLQLDGDHVIGIIEKPGEENMPSPYWKFFVDYFPDIQDFIAVLENTSSELDDVYERALTEYIQSGKAFTFIEYKNDWATLKYPWHVLDAMNFFLSKKVLYVSASASVSETSVINGDVYIDEGAKVYEYSKIVGPAYIGRNATIGNFAMVSGSMIESNSVIGAYSEITRSYIGREVWTHRAYIGDSVIEGPANFGAGSIAANLRFDKKDISSHVKGVKTDTKRGKLGLIAGRNLEMGVRATTMPGVKIAPGKSIMPGTVVYKDVV